MLENGCVVCVCGVGGGEEVRVTNALSVDDTLPHMHVCMCGTQMHTCIFAMHMHTCIHVCMMMPIHYAHIRTTTKTDADREREER